MDRHDSSSASSVNYSSVCSCVVAYPRVSYLTLKRINRIKRRLRNNHFFRTQTGRKQIPVQMKLQLLCFHSSACFSLTRVAGRFPQSTNIWKHQFVQFTMLAIDLVTNLCFQGQRQQMLIKATIQTAKTASKLSLRWDRRGVALPANLVTVYLLGVIRADYFLLNFFVCFV